MTSTPTLFQNSVYETGVRELEENSPHVKDNGLDSSHSEQNNWGNSIRKTIFIELHRDQLCKTFQKKTLSERNNPVYDD